jgi:hypothetical protein
VGKYRIEGELYGEGDRVKEYRKVNGGGYR